MKLPLWFHMVENYVKKPKIKRNNEKKFSLIEVHFLIAPPVTHPSPDWARCCCNSATK